MPHPDGHLTHAELGTTTELRADCQAIASFAPGIASAMEKAMQRAARRAVETPPSLLFADYPREVHKREIKVDEAAARLAAALHLHLD